MASPQLLGWLGCKAGLGCYVSTPLIKNLIYFYVFCAYATQNPKRTLAGQWTFTSTREAWPGHPKLPSRVRGRGPAGHLPSTCLCPSALHTLRES